VFILAQLLVIEIVLKPSNAINPMLEENTFLNARAGLLANKPDTSSEKIEPSE
jgi:hypothetical protein